MHRVGPATLIAWAVAVGPTFAQTTQPQAPPAAESSADDARQESPLPIQVGIGILATVPLGTFGENIESAGGVSGHLGVWLGSSVVNLGGELTYLWYGEEHRRVPFSLTIPDAELDVNTSNAMFLAHGRLRVQPRQGRWRPYADGLLGLTDIFTKTSVDLGTFCSVSCTDIGPSTTNLRSVALSYGGGVGVMIGFGSPPSAARLDISVRYLRGGEADYLRQGAIRRENGQVFLDKSRSRTDMIAIFIGVSGG
jgi:hypothetical protein